MACVSLGSVNIDGVLAACVPPEPSPFDQTMVRLPFRHIEPVAVPVRVQDTRDSSWDFHNTSREQRHPTGRSGAASEQRFCEKRNLDIRSFVTRLKLGHKSVQVLSEYVRNAELFKDHPATDFCDATVYCNEACSQRDSTEMLVDAR